MVTSAGFSLKFLVLWIVIFLPCAEIVCIAQGTGYGRIAPEKSVGKATATYFRKENHVTVQIRPLQVAGSLSSGIVLIPSFIVPGKRVVVPKIVNLQFIVDTATGVRSPERKVRIFVEGREMMSGIPALLSTSRPTDGSVTRVLMYKMPYAKLLQILAAQTVMMKVGETEFELTEAQLEAMRDLQKMIDERVSFP